ncbi:hypothetical protein GM3708_319 [Geminocystis sp. NIES-3708]|uniref:hypothetical protein n=1 Tax=Geminocystis sp. NIES-3708 TaxID=1615909 RepID=UPI0005FC5D37|nr:hypothetical protein [Geminocystis sp. NIES-3708]BAQ59913.1 hypothetical protein GM3708_319 [Geminocystis sp. NIES-3708]
MYKFKTLFVIFLSAITLVSVTGKNVMAQATATGSVFIFNPNTGYSQSVSGEITIPAGSFNGLEVTPNFRTSLVGDNNFFPTNPLQAPITDLLINPQGINFTLAPSLNAETAALLSGLSVNGNLPEIISILRANPDLLRDGSQNQAIATGQTTLIAPDGSVQSVSGEIALPNGLFYQGWEDLVNGPCGPSATGCLIIYSVDPNSLVNPLAPNYRQFGTIPQDPNTPRIEQLIINPGPVSLFSNNGNNYDLNAAAAQILSAVPINELSNVVSIIRAASGSSGPFSSRVQGRAMGVTMISTPSGTTQSVSGEINLPVGLYFDDPEGLSTNCPGNACLTVLPDIQWYGNSADTAYIQQLVVDPGFVQPGDPNNVTFALRSSSFDFNAAAADILYQYIDNGSLSDVVSVIRAGAGADGLTPKNRPVARASGTVTLTLPNGAVQSVTAELSLPNSLYYTGANSCGSACLVVTPTLDTAAASLNNDPNLLSVTSLLIDPGTANDPTLIRGWDFDAAAANALNQAGDLQAQVSIIRAGAGASNGLE